MLIHFPTSSMRIFLYSFYFTLFMVNFSVLNSQEVRRTDRRVDSRTGHLEVFLQVPSVNASVRSNQEDGQDGNSAPLNVYEFHLKGRHFKRSRKLGEALSLNWQDVPRNIYSYLVKRDNETIHQGKLTIVQGKRTRLRLQVMGLDHRKSDGSYFCVPVVEEGAYEGATRTYHEGWQDTAFSNGTREIFFRGQVVGKTFRKESYRRYDSDNDLLSDLEDNDDDNDGQKDHQDLDDDNDGIRDQDDDDDADNDNDGILNELEVKDQIMGVLQFPILESLDIKNLTNPGKGLYGNLGDLIQVQVRADSAGGSKIQSVMLSVYRHGKSQFFLNLYDDGSLLDWNPLHPGRQISGDAKEGDEIYTITIPLDLVAVMAMYDSVWQVEVSNSRGLPGNALARFVRKAHSQFLPSESSDILEIVQGIQLEYLKSESLDRISGMNVALKLAKECRVRAYIGSRNFFLAPEKNTLKFIEYFDSFTVRSGESFFLTVTDGSGGVFYLGHTF